MKVPNGFVSVDETTSDPPRPVVIRVAEIAAVDSRSQTVYLCGGSEIQLSKRHSVEAILLAIQANGVPAPASKKK